MINFRLFIIVPLIAILLSGQSYAGGDPIYSHSSKGQQQVAFRNFWHPMYLGQRLDYCCLGENACGKTVADRYCKLMGYEYSNQQIKANNVGLTHYLGTHARCKGWGCNGFMTIVCAKKTSHTPPKSYHYRKKRFAYPRYNHYRVDWCYKDEQGCGGTTALSFCRRMGFMFAKGFAQDKAVHASRTLGNKKLCFGPDCKGFKYIICSR